MAAGKGDMAMAPTGDMAMTTTGDMDTDNGDAATAFSIVESCAEADYVDMTTTSGVIAVTPWDTSLGKKCLKVSVGAQVSWAASATHPLTPTTGTTPTPIPVAAITATTVTFANVGTYGYECAVHTTQMHGAIWVVE